MDQAIASDRSPLQFSLLILGLAAALAAVAVWLLAPALVHSRAQTWVMTFSLPDHPCLAARLAVVRGDLWAACAEDASGESREPARQAALADSVRWAPSRSMSWLRIAAGKEESGRSDRRLVEALRMSFYTGPNELDVIAMRLSVSLRAGMLVDTDMERLVRHDVFTVLTHAPDLRPALIAAYRQASSQGRRFLEAAVEEIDPRFVPELRSDGVAQPGNKE
jgi:hypothetical protein